MTTKRFWCAYNEIRSQPVLAKAVLANTIQPVLAKTVCYKAVIMPMQHEKVCVLHIPEYQAQSSVRRALK